MFCMSRQEIGHFNVGILTPTHLQTKLVDWSKTLNSSLEFKHLLIINEQISNTNKHNSCQSNLVSGAPFGFVPEKKLPNRPNKKNWENGNKTKSSPFFFI